MNHKQKRGNPVAGVNAGDCRGSRPRRTRTEGLRLVAGGVIVFASLGLALYAGRVEAGWPGSSTAQLPPIQAWLPWFMLGFLVLAGLAWHRLPQRTLQQTDPLAGGLQMTSGPGASCPRNSRQEPSGSGDTDRPEDFPAAVARHLRNCTKQSTYVALAIVSIDDFQQIADAIGQEPANERLQQAGRSLQSLVRSLGGVFTGPRTGDDRHFLALLPNTDPDQALQASEDMRMTVEDLGYDSPVPPRRIMTASLGLAVMVPDAHNHQDALFSAAEKALERSQRHGGNRVEVKMLDNQPDR